MASHAYQTNDRFTANTPVNAQPNTPGNAQLNARGKGLAHHHRAQDTPELHRATRLLSALSTHVGVHILRPAATALMLLASTITRIAASAHLRASTTTTVATGAATGAATGQSATPWQSTPPQLEAWPSIGSAATPSAISRLHPVDAADCRTLLRFCRGLDVRGVLDAAAATCGCAVDWTTIGWKLTAPDTTIDHIVDLAGKILVDLLIIDQLGATVDTVRTRCLATHPGEALAEVAEQLKTIATAYTAARADGEMHMFELLAHIIGLKDTNDDAVITTATSAR